MKETVSELTEQVADLNNKLEAEETVEENVAYFFRLKLDDAM